MQQTWKLQSTKVRKSVAMKEHDDRGELNPRCLLPCSKTWPSGVRIITNGRSLSRGRFRGRIIKQMLTGLVGLNTFTSFPHLAQAVSAWTFHGDKGTTSRASPEVSGFILSCSISRLEFKLTFRHHQPKLLQHQRFFLSQFSKSVVETWREVAQYELPDP